MAIFRLEIKSKKGNIAMAHYQYVNRDGRYKNKEDLEYKKEFNIPKEFKNGKDFIKTGIENERKDGRIIYSFTVTLPKEFSSKENEKLIENFCKKEFSDHVYMIAVHNPKGLNPHAHVLVNERKLDNIERPKEQFFKRPNDKLPEKGGAKKDRKFNEKTFYKQIRKSWEESLNEKLEEKGYTKVRSENKYFLKLEEVTSREENKDLSQDELKKIAKEELKSERGLRNRKEINQELFEIKKSEIKDRLISNHLRSKELKKEIWLINYKLKSLDEMAVNIYTKGNLQKNYSNKIKAIRKEIYQNKGNQRELEKLESRLQKVTDSKEEFLKKYRTDENVLKLKEELKSKYELEKIKKLAEQRACHAEIKSIIKKSSLKEMREVMKELKSQKGLSELIKTGEQELKKSEIESKKERGKISKAGKEISEKIGKLKGLIRPKKDSKDVNFNINLRKIKEEERGEEMDR